MIIDEAAHHSGRRHAAYFSTIFTCGSHLGLLDGSTGLIGREHDVLFSSDREDPMEVVSTVSSAVGNINHQHDLRWPPQP